MTDNLGMDAGISRGDFLNASLIGGGAMALAGSPLAALSQTDWNGYGGDGDYSDSNGNTFSVVTAGHKIRDGDFDSLPGDVHATGEAYDCVVVGGGISGLAAALFFARNAGANRRCLVLDNHPIFGGEAKRNEFVVDGQRLIAHQGSAVYFVQYPHSFLARFYDSVGLRQPKLTYQRWNGSSPQWPIGITPYDQVDGESSHYGFYFGAKFGRDPGMWLIDPFKTQLRGAPISERARTELLRFHHGPVRPQPPPEYHGDPISRRLDTMTLETHMMAEYGIGRETIRTFLSPVSGGGSGLGPDALSAYADYAADLLHPLDTENGDQMFPGGNDGIARLIVKALVPMAFEGDDSVEAVYSNRVNFAGLDREGAPTRIRLDATVVWVRHAGRPENADAVDIVYTKDGRRYHVRARSVIMAGGGWTTKHIVRDLPAAQTSAYEQFHRSPCLMINVALRNWRFMYKMGISGFRWFEGIGNYTEVRRSALLGGTSPTIDPDSPVVLNLKVLFSYPGMPTRDQGIRGRAELYATSFSDYEHRIRTQLNDMFARYGFDAKRDIAGIILNRWGHAYLSPQPGFFFGTSGSPAPSDVLRGAPFGRIAFANTDLAGIMDHRSSILEAQRAVEQLLNQVLA